jgi:antitoxin PrlF
MPRTQTTRAARKPNDKPKEAEASVAYVGTITTTGKSEAIRLEKALFRSHPEFRQKSKVKAHVIGHGTMLLSVTDEATAESEADPVMAAFLQFLDGEIARSPERIRPLSATRIAEARALTKEVEASDDESLPDDVTL